MHPELKKFLFLGGVILLISGSLLAWRFGWVPEIGKFFAAELPTGDVAVSANGISIVSMERFAYGIGSLVWNGREFVNIFDHGRQIQTAWQNNNRSECFNPTEAGSLSDGNSSTTTSVVRSHAATASSFSTTLNPAYWLAPGQTSQWCQYFDPTGSNTATNTTTVSDALLTRTTAIGVQGIPNAIEYTTTITLGFTDTAVMPLRYILLENPATYLLSEFNVLYTYNPATDALTRFDPALYPYAYSNLPFVATNAAGTHVLGLYTDEIPAGGFPQYAELLGPQASYIGYAYNELSAAYQTVYASVRTPKVPPAGRTTFVAGDIIRSRSFIAVGTLDQVRDAMRRLFALYPAPGYPTAVPPPTCSAPASHVAVGEPITFTGSEGGTRSYTWNAPDSTPSAGGGPSFVATYATAGDKTVTVTDGDGNTGTCGIVVDSMVTIIPGDANRDGKVDILDFNIVISHFGQTGRSIPGDVNQDGVVNILDFNIVISHFGR